ncbi:hypothetical protein MY11210_005462 [Beauveria gryllotalpidicola]
MASAPIESASNVPVHAFQISVEHQLNPTAFLLHVMRIAASSPVSEDGKWVGSPSNHPWLGRKRFTPRLLYISMEPITDISIKPGNMILHHVLPARGDDFQRRWEKLVPAELHTRMRAVLEAARVDPIGNLLPKKILIESEQSESDEEASPEGQNSTVSTPAVVPSPINNGQLDRFAQCLGIGTGRDAQRRKNPTPARLDSSRDIPATPSRPSRIVDTKQQAVATPSTNAGTGRDAQRRKNPIPARLDSSRDIPATPSRPSRIVDTK